MKVNRSKIIALNTFNEMYEIHRIHKGKVFPSMQIMERNGNCTSLSVCPMFSEYVVFGRDCNTHVERSLQYKNDIVEYIQRMNNITYICFQRGDADIIKYHPQK